MYEIHWLNFVEQILNEKNQSPLEIKAFKIMYFILYSETGTTKQTLQVVRRPNSK